MLVTPLGVGGRQYDRAHAAHNDRHAQSAHRRRDRNPSWLPRRVAGCASSTSSTVTRPRAADANYQLIQKPDAGYSPIIDLISRRFQKRDGQPHAQPDKGEGNGDRRCAVLTWRFLPG
jgi:hypothetical protein